MSTRYTVGEKVLFMRVDFNRNRPAWTGVEYHPWEDELKGVSIIALKCKEHHVVPGDWDNKPQYDGFVFHDVQGRIWNNQYPRASYGQLDDSGNYKVFPDDSVDLKERMYDVRFYLENILRWIKSFKDSESLSDNQADKEQAQKAIPTLRDFFDKINEQLKDFNVKAVNIGLTAKNKDGSTDHYPTIPKVILVPLDSDIQHISY